MHGWILPSCKRAAPDITWSKQHHQEQSSTEPTHRREQYNKLENETASFDSDNRTQQRRVNRCLKYSSRSPAVLGLAVSPIANTRGELRGRNRNHVLCTPATTRSTSRPSEHRATRKESTPRDICSPYPCKNTHKRQSTATAPSPALIRCLSCHLYQSLSPNQSGDTTCICGGKIGLDLLCNETDTSEFFAISSDLGYREECSNALTPPADFVPSRFYNFSAFLFGIDNDKGELDEWRDDSRLERRRQTTARLVAKRRG